MEFGLKAAMNNMDSSAKTGLLRLENTERADFECAI